jgi:hypothetical protein
MRLECNYCTVMAWRNWGNTLKHNKNIDYLAATQLRVASSHTLLQSALRDASSSSFARDSWRSTTAGSNHTMDTPQECCTSQLLVRYMKSTYRQRTAVCSITNLSKSVLGLGFRLVFERCRVEILVRASISLRSIFAFLQSFLTP